MTLALELLRRFWPLLVIAWFLVYACIKLDAWGDRRFDAGAASVQATWDAEKLDALVTQSVHAGFADAIHKRTSEAAISIQTETRADTAAALGRIEDAISEFGADLARRGCPVDVPAGVRAEGRKAVDAARAAGGEVRQGKAGARTDP